MSTMLDIQSRAELHHSDKGSMELPTKKSRLLWIALLFVVIAGIVSSHFFLGTLRYSHLVRGSKRDPTIISGPENKAQYSKWFRQNGGIFINLHHPKTGGTTIKEFIMGQMRNESHYMRMLSRKAWKKAVHIIDTAVREGTSGEPIFMDSQVYPPFSKYLLPKIREWRTIAKENNVPFFAFTVHREPVDYSKSFFNYFWVTNRGVNATAEEFKRHTCYNPQCDFLVRGHTRQVRHMTDENACRQIFNDTIEALDWISTTDRFDKELLPLIAHLAKLQHRDLGVVQPRMFGKPKSKLGSLSESQKDMVRNRTKLDKELYETIRRRYNFGNWREYLESQGAMSTCTWSKETGLCEYADGLRLPTGELPPHLKS